jgi:DNA-binding MarR family transcriptional regulator
VPKLPHVAERPGGRFSYGWLMTLTTSRHLDVANELRPAVLHLARRLRRELAPLGITGGQAALLHAVRTHPGIGIRGLAELEGVSTPAMTAYVDRLQAAGLVGRRRSERDRRRVELELTAEGARVLRSARSRRTAWLAARLGRLEPEEVARIEDALPALLRLLEDEA